MVIDGEKLGVDAAFGKILQRFNGAVDGDRRRGCAGHASCIERDGFNGAVDGDRRREARRTRPGNSSRSFNGAVDGDRRRVALDGHLHDAGVVLQRGRRW